MKKQIKPLLLLFLLPLQLLAQSVKSDITIRHINVVDVKSGAIQKNQLVVIKDHKITDIRLDNKKLSLTTTSLDGTDKYLIPGLWDMHSHNNWDVDSKAYKFPMMLANGVTGLRYMLGTKKELQLRDSINQNLLVAPPISSGQPFGKRARYLLS